MANQINNVVCYFSKLDNFVNSYFFWKRAGMPTVLVYKVVILVLNLCVVYGENDYVVYILGLPDTAHCYLLSSLYSSLFRQNRQQRNLTPPLIW